jgi:hypothetical protein
MPLPLFEKVIRWIFITIDNPKNNGVAPYHPPHQMVYSKGEVFFFAI